MTPDRHSDENPLARFRAAALRRSVALGWIVLIILATQAVRESVFQHPRYLLPSALFGVVLVASALVDWDHLMIGPSGPWLAWGWVVSAVLCLAGIASVSPLHTATEPLFFGIVALSGLVLDPAKHAFVTLLTLAALAFTAILGEGVDALADVAAPVLSAGVVAAATALVGAEFQREAERSSKRLVELQRQRADFERLYAVSATLAGADSLPEVLPQLVGRICSYLSAQVGVVMLYNADLHELKMLSPIWVNGVPLEIAEIRIPVMGGGIIAQVFKSGKAVLLDRIAENPDNYGVLGELGLNEAMVAPLKVEQFKVGVIAVGDPQQGAFRGDQLEALSSLGAPAALVLSQLGRYEAAAEMTRRLEEVAQMKTDFVSVVSHELRTPLTSIIGSLDTVSRPELTPEAETARSLLSTARRQAGRLQRLIEDLLMISRIDRNAVPMQLESLAVRPFLEEVINLVTNLPKVDVVVEPDDLTVIADPDHLNRIFINILENAGKYASGSPVEVVARSRDSVGEIMVVDHGAGIAADQRDRIFEPFTQIEHSTTRTRGGTGLGLSIVKGLSEAMSGSVELRETPGGGATFIIRLPRIPSVQVAASVS
jgi:signal transduction histidine kinase